MKKAIVIGASSGIGRSLAKLLACEGFTVGVTARRVDLLEQLAEEIASESLVDSVCLVRTMDIVKYDEAITVLDDMISEIGGMDLLVICSGTGHLNPDLNLAMEMDTISVNVSGFTALICHGASFMERQGHGHIVGVSSIAALRGGRAAPAYNASKAYVSNYLEGLRQRFFKLAIPVKITEAQPGFVDTRMAQGEGLFWVASPEKAATQIYRAIKLGREHVYVTKRWRLIAWLMKMLPASLYKRL
ncbi:MAG: oxidoreductase [Candidatus Wallbacteria bacterium HGW-Wallbacteria-1]|uniref:Oxidoreductase n=1 Tax=Candidatus Wallbacteria bacterium HGW-Wallbacteria-1 TaxID=2013854 RepID=A0A2N1PJD3_9BACT|nr:MAG: oxidoreductase [Candidatus Wallbacteria bacterium HGW-Wallbacteria-1]